MTHDITIIVQDPKWRTALPEHETVVNAACTKALEASYQDARPAAVSIVLANDHIIRQMNQDYRQKDAPTNVLAFPAGANPATLSDDEPLPLGDIILSLQTIQKESKDQVKTLENHVSHLTVHGTLHLLGYDHIQPKDADKMEALEVEILAGLGIGNPYY